jgi:ubiquinone/menaquinone biosynthesis C-methylase UbiE
MEKNPNRLANEAAFQDERMRLALAGQSEFRDKFYFVNRLALKAYDRQHNDLKGKRVVVVGCADGMVTILARQGIYVEGTDISSVSLEKLQRSIDRERLGEFASTRLMNAENLEYPDDSIDAITCSGVLHHIDTERALASWARCLKENGKVVLFEPLAFHPFAALFRALTPRMRTPDEHPLRGRDFKLMTKYFDGMVRNDFGLTTPGCAAIATLPGMQRPAQILLRLFEVADSALLRVIPPLRTFCWLTVVTLTRPKKDRC